MSEQPDIEALREAVIEAAIDRHGLWIIDETDPDDVAICAAVSDLLAALEQAEPEPEDELVWVERTWRDVRAGDTVRPPGSDTYAGVDSAQLQAWHVDPVKVSWQLNENGKMAPVPISMEHEVMCTYLLFPGQVKPQRYDMNPEHPVEISLWTSDVKAAEIFGWAGRVAVNHRSGPA